jgi:hypothetical protein
MIMVPEDQTVAGNVAAAVEVGMKQSGFKFDPADPTAVPVMVSVNNFWVGRDLEGLGGRAWYTHDINVTVGDQTYNLKQSQTDKYYWELGPGKVVSYAGLTLQSIANEAAQKIVAPVAVATSTN